MCKNPDDPQECFPPALRNLPKTDERLGANVNENGHGSNKLRTCDDCPIKEERLQRSNQGDINDKGRDAAVVKIVAGMLGLDFDTLWQRYEREKAEEERKIKEQRDKLLIAQSRFLAEKANALVEEGDSYTARLLALEALPKNIEKPDRPYVREAECALRNSFGNHLFSYKVEEIGKSIFFNANGDKLITATRDGKVKSWHFHNRTISDIFGFGSIGKGEIISFVLDHYGKRIAFATPSCIYIYRISLDGFIDGESIQPENILSIDNQ